MIALKIDVKKISKDLLYKGQKGTYLDCTLKDNQHGTDEFGNDGFIAQSVSKEAREAGERGPIIGNWKHVGQRAPQDSRQPASSRSPVSGQRTAPAKPVDADLDGVDEDDIPF